MTNNAPRNEFPAVLGRFFKLVNSSARDRAVQAVLAAPDGFTVQLKEPTRNLEQNALLWELLEKFSKQLKWPVNGKLCYLTAEEWKDILSAAFNKERLRVAEGLNGGLVLLGLRTSVMSKTQFSEFIEFIYSVAADREVDVETN